MARVETIVVGGGVNAGSPFTVNRIPYISNTDPPFLVASPVLFQVLGVNPAITISPTGVDPQASTTTILRVAGGIASFPLNTVAGRLHCVLGARQIVTNFATTQDMTIIGNDIIGAPGSGATIVGKGISSLSTCAQVIIGTGIVFATGTNDGVVIIGDNISVGQNNGGSAGKHVYIGSNQVIGGGAAAISVECTLIGANISASADHSVNSVVGASCQLNNATFSSGIGRNNRWSAGVAHSVAVGANNVLAHSNCVMLGDGNTTSAQNQCWIGGAGSGSTGITSVIIGKGEDSSAPSSVTIRLTNGNGADVAGANLTMQCGAGTGAGAASSIIFQTPTVGASSSVLQTLATRLTITAAAVTSTVAVVHPAGAVGTPSIRFTDADTGLFEQAAGNVAVAVQGIESARFSAGAAGETNFMLFDVDNGTLERVSVGIANSGGVGFKVLCIPN